MPRRNAKTKRCGKNTEVEAPVADISRKQADDVQGIPTGTTQPLQACNERQQLKVEVKLEPPDVEDLFIKSSIPPPPPDLSQFKFEKKFHVKIEFENESPPKIESKGLWEPPNWRQFLANLRIMRSKKDAPVDTMGCHKAMDLEASPAVMRFHSLVALMLSSQTKDQVTFAAMQRLKEKGLVVDNVLSWSDDELGKLIYPVGFWRTKIKYLKKTSQILKDQYDCDIPDSVEKLCKLPGVGPKMAHICMSVAWNKITGIGVDTHVHRISNRIGWVKKPTNIPEDTRKSLESWLPFDLWHEVNHLMVGFGQTICQPISPLCNECLNKNICPSSGKGRKTPVKKSPMKKENNTPDSKQELTELKIKGSPTNSTEDNKDDFDVEKGKKAVKRKVPKLKLDTENKVTNDASTELKAKVVSKNKIKKEISQQVLLEEYGKDVMEEVLNGPNNSNALKRRSPRNKGDVKIQESVNNTTKKSKK